MHVLCVAFTFIRRRCHIRVTYACTFASTTRRVRLTYYGYELRYRLGFTCYEYVYVLRVRDCPTFTVRVTFYVHVYVVLVAFTCYVSRVSVTVARYVCLLRFVAFTYYVYD